MAGVRRQAFWLGAIIALQTGCGGPQVHLPAGHLPNATVLTDARTADRLVVSKASAEPIAPPATGRPAFEVPSDLPGGASPPLIPPRFPPNTPAAERDKAVRAAYPKLTPVGATNVVSDGPALSLAELQQLAIENNPVLRRAAADAEAMYGTVVQAGLYPNPTVGYQVDQWQPSLKIPAGSTGSGSGQQGGYINQLIKTAGKLSLAQSVAGFDYVNALVAVRRARVDVTGQVRTNYFAVLVAQQGVSVNRALASMADEVYRLQLRLVAAGEAAGYEPLQLYAQAEQARNSLAQSEANYAAAWKQLAVAVGRPTMPPAPLTGRADIAAPRFDFETVKAALLEHHTDLLTAQNTIEQARVNLTLQRKVPIPDLQTNTYHQYDNLAQTYQFGVQVGISLPISDRNQGNIRQAAAKIARSVEDLTATQNDLTGRLAEAYGRYQSNTATADRYRDNILPTLTQAYRALVRRYQVEPEKVGFNDIAVAQQNIAQALQAYVTALDGQWKAVVDLATLGQLDELFP